jgi:inorganic pyrophosphatase
MKNTIKVVVECLAESDTKNVFDEATLQEKESFTVSRKYPFPYGFIQGTKSGDGDCLDCFLITKRPLTIKEIVEVEVVGMFEQFETRDNTRKEDHNILVKFQDEDIDIDDTVKETLRDFVLHVWDHRVGKRVEVGNFYGKGESEALIKSLTL